MFYYLDMFDLSSPSNIWVLRNFLWLAREESSWIMVNIEGTCILLYPSVCKRLYWWDGTEEELSWCHESSGMVCVTVAEGSYFSPCSGIWGCIMQPNCKSTSDLWLEGSCRQKPFLPNQIDAPWWKQLLMDLALKNQLRVDRVWLVIILWSKLAYSDARNTGQNAYLRTNFYCRPDDNNAILYSFRNTL